MTILYANPITALSLSDGQLITSVTEGSITIVEKAVGDYALQCVLPAGATYQAKTLAQPNYSTILTDAYLAGKFRFIYNLQTNPSEAHRLTLFNMSGASGLRIIANRDGTFQWIIMCVNKHTDGLVVVEEFLSPVSSSIFDGGDHFIQLHWLRSSTAGIVEAWCDGISIGMVTGLNTADVSGYAPYYQGGVNTFYAGLVSPNGLFGTPQIVALVDDITIANQYIESGVTLKYDLTINPAVGGNTDPVAGIYTYDPEASVTVTAIPNSGYILFDWLVNGVSSGISTNSIIITMYGDVTVTPVFTTPNVITLTLAPPIHGTYLTGTRPGFADVYLGEGVHPVIIGSTVYFGIVPDTGYEFKGWNKEVYRASDGSFYSSSGGVLTNPWWFSASTTTYNYVIIPVFALIPITYHDVVFNSTPIHVTATINGVQVASPNGVVQVLSGSTVTIIAPSEVVQ